MQNMLLVRHKLPIIRTAAIIAVPAFASLLGIVWLRRRRRKSSTSLAADSSVPGGAAILPENCDDHCENKSVHVDVEASSATVIVIASDCGAASDSSLSSLEVIEKITSGVTELSSALPMISDLDEVDLNSSCRDESLCATSILPDQLSPGAENSSALPASSFDDVELNSKSEAVSSCEHCPLLNPVPSDGDENKVDFSLDSISVDTQIPNEDCFVDIGFSEALCFEGSPKSMNTIDANNDVLSEDSGHGGSNDLAGFCTNLLQTHQFYFPAELCGMLIGKEGRIIKGISRRSGAEISVRAHPVVKHFQLVVISGTESQISRALHDIGERFPTDLYPHITYENIASDSCISPVEPVQIQFTQMFLGEDASLNDVIVSSVVAPDHVFVQQPNSDCFRFLEIQNYAMQACYEQPMNNIELPRPILENTVCVSPMFNGWFRALVISYYPESDECLVRFVDYGGYARLAAYLLQQIRSDFTSLPFQAVECYLSDIVSPVDGSPYPEEAKVLMEHLVRAQHLIAQVNGSAEDGVACINLFRCCDGNWFSITEELVSRGLARRVSNTDCND